MTVHIIIPDTQVKPGVDTSHLKWIGAFIHERFASYPDLKVIHLGDHWDMEALSSYDKGKKSMEGRRVNLDIEAGNRAFALIDRPFVSMESARRKAGLPAVRKVITLGNHEARISRACEDDPQLDGVLSLDDLDTQDWERFPFLTPVTIDGVTYCHYFQNPMTGRPHGGTALNRLKTLGYSFVMGHQQTLDSAMRYVINGEGEYVSQHGLVAGACYLHDESYKGVQGNPHFRGIVVLHNVRGGQYDLEVVSLDRLRNLYA